jgi:hypothetical protein
MPCTGAAFVSFGSVESKEALEAEVVVMASLVERKDAADKAAEREQWQLQGQEERKRQQERDRQWWQGQQERQERQEHQEHQEHQERAKLVREEEEQEEDREKRKEREQREEAQRLQQQIEQEQEAEENKESKVHDDNGTFAIEDLSISGAAADADADAAANSSADGGSAGAAGVPSPRAVKGVPSPRPRLMVPGATELPPPFSLGSSRTVDAAVTSNDRSGGARWHQAGGADTTAGRAMLADDPSGVELARRLRVDDWLLRPRSKGPVPEPKDVEWNALSMRQRDDDDGGDAVGDGTDTSANSVRRSRARRCHRRCRSTLVKLFVFVILFLFSSPVAVLSYVNSTAKLLPQIRNGTVYGPGSDIDNNNNNGGNGLDGGACGTTSGMDDGSPLGRACDSLVSSVRSLSPTAADALLAWVPTLLLSIANYAVLMVLWWTSSLEGEGANSGGGGGVSGRRRTRALARGGIYSPRSGGDSGSASHVNSDNSLRPKVPSVPSVSRQFRSTMRKAFAYLLLSTLVLPSAGVASLALLLQVGAALTPPLTRSLPVLLTTDSLLQALTPALPSDLPIPFMPTLSPTVPPALGTLDVGQDTMGNMDSMSNMGSMGSMGMDLEALPQPPAALRTQLHSAVLLLSATGEFLINYVIQRALIGTGLSLLHAGKLQLNNTLAAAPNLVPGFMLSQYPFSYPHPFPIHSRCRSPPADATMGAQTGSDGSGGRRSTTTLDILLRP